MISFNLTSPAQEELSNEWKTNHRLASHDSPPRQEFRQPFIVETLKLNSRKHFKSFNAQDRIKNFRRIATVETKCQFEFDRDEEPLSTDPIYLINDAVDYLTHVLQPVLLFLAFAVILTMRSTKWKPLQEKENSEKINTPPQIQPTPNHHNLFCNWLWWARNFYQLSR